MKLKTNSLFLTAPTAYDCNFEQGFCQWTQSVTDNFNWTRVQGPTGSSLTGPTNDHTTGSSKYTDFKMEDFYLEIGDCYHICYILLSATTLWVNTADDDDDFPRKKNALTFQYQCLFSETVRKTILKWSLLEFLPSMLSCKVLSTAVAECIHSVCSGLSLPTMCKKSV